MAELPAISIRKYIRRGDGPAEEPTSTLVLTSKAKFYVDVRVLKLQDGASIGKLDWAFAGTSTTTPAEYEAGKLKKPAHTAWSHWIDSDTMDEVNDEGDMYLQPDGTVLEKGVNTDGSTYEELWEEFDAQITAKDRSRVSYVLRADEPSKKMRGVLIRIGEWIQGTLKVGHEMTVARWQWSVEDAKWKEMVGIGSGLIPCESLFEGFLKDGTPGMQVGSTITAADEMKWTCIEAFLW